MLFNQLNNFRLLLASKSPRRQYLLKELGLSFEVITREIDENFPPYLKASDIPLYLCEKKANAFEQNLKANDLLITADTIVWINNTVLNKPENYDDAIRMLTILSGNMHEVYTAVCLKTVDQMHSFVVCTKVYFKTLSKIEMEYYITNYKPYDKAGAYGAQEFMGYIAVEKIEGSYFNVMGLPMKELYEALQKFTLPSLHP